MNTQDKLLPHHQEMLYQQSGISPEISEQRGCRSVTIKSDLKSLGFGENQRQVPTLLMPLWNTRGEIGLYHHRPDEPRVDAKRGKPIKYEFPKGSRMMIDVHPALTSDFDNGFWPTLMF